MLPCPCGSRRFADAVLSIRAIDRSTSSQPLYFLYPRSVFKSAPYKFSSSIAQKLNNTVGRPENEAVTSLQDILSSPAVRTKALVKDATRLAVRRSRKEFRRDELRSKGSWSWDFTVPLTKLKKATANKRDPVSRSILETRLTSIDLHDNNYVGVEVSAIPVPDAWTKSTFAQYVHDLCQSQMPHQLGRGLNHQDKIFQLLEHKLFTPESAQLVTAEALNSAIKFCYKLESVHLVRKLYRYAKRIGPYLSNGIVDTILRNAAKKHDVYVFTSLLDEALLSDFTPSEKTWASLLICLEDPKARRIVLSEMKEYGVLTEKETREDVDAIRLELMLTDNPSLLQNIPELESRMDTEFSKDWLTIRSANAFLKQLCELPAGQPIVDFLNTTTTKNCKLNLDSMNLLLLRHNRCTDLGTALKVLTSFINDHSVVPNETSYALLFGTAWKLRYVNSCKLLWTAACLHRRATQSMTSRLLRSFSRLSQSAGTAKRMWNWQAGRLIAGIQIENAGDLEDPGNQRDQDGMNLLEHDQSLYQRYYYPLKAVTRQLAEAYERDQSWRAAKIHTLPVEELRDLMIKPLFKPIVK